MNYVLGVDLGTQQDFTAIVLLKRVEKLTAKTTLRRDEERTVVSHYQVPLLEQLALGTEYPLIIARVKQILELPQLYGQCQLVVDATGVGLPVLQQMRGQGLSPIGVTITGGSTVGQNSSGYTVPKQELVSTTQVLFQQKRIQIARALALADHFMSQLKKFKVKVTAARNETWEGDKDHDDIVMAAAIAFWYAEKMFGYPHAAPTEEDLEPSVYEPLWSPI